MPDISTGIDRAFLVIIGRYIDLVQDSLRGSDLVWTHDEQQLLRREHTESGEDTQDGVPCQKRLCKINQIRDNPVIGIGPVGGELEAVAGLF